jgi:hypothetical protein
MMLSCAESMSPEQQNMASSKDNNSGFRLVPFIQNKSNSLSFFLSSPYHDKPVVNFFIDVQDYSKPDAFFDILTVAVDSMILGKPPAGRDT